MVGHWSELVGDELAAKRTRGPRRSVGLNFPPKLFSIAVRAARARNLSFAAYARRCVMAIACYDLGLDYREVMVDEPAARPYGTRIEGDLVRKNGVDHGRWRVVELGEFDGPAATG